MRKSGLFGNFLQMVHFAGLTEIILSIVNLHRKLDAFLNEKCLMVVIVSSRGVLVVFAVWLHVLFRVFVW